MDLITYLRTMMSLNSTFSDEELTVCLRKHLSTLPLCHELDSPLLHRDEDGTLRIFYGHFREGTGFQLELRDTSCYFDYIKRDQCYRGKGFGRQLYLALEGFLREIGCTSIILSSSDGEKQDFWMSLGFRLTDECDLEKRLD